MRLAPVFLSFALASVPAAALAQETTLSPAEQRLHSACQPALNAALDVNLLTKTMSKAESDVLVNDVYARFIKPCLDTVVQSSKEQNAQTVSIVSRSPFAAEKAAQMEKAKAVCSVLPDAPSTASDAASFAALKVLAEKERACTSATSNILDTIDSPVTLYLGTQRDTKTHDAHIYTSSCLGEIFSPHPLACATLKERVRKPFYRDPVLALARSTLFLQSLKKLPAMIVRKWKRSWDRLPPDVLLTEEEQKQLKKLERTCSTAINMANDLPELIELRGKKEAEEIWQKLYKPYMEPCANKLFDHTKKLSVSMRAHFDATNTYNTNLSFINAQLWTECERTFWLPANVLTATQKVERSQICLSTIWNIAHEANNFRQTPAQQNMFRGFQRIDRDAWHKRLVQTARCWELADNRNRYGCTQDYPKRDILVRHKSH